MTERLSISDLGTSLQITVKEDDAIVDISTATATDIILRKPDGTEVEKTGSLLTDGTDGIVAYSTLSGDIDQKGIWSYRAKITFSATQVYRTINPVEFRVVN